MLFEHGLDAILLATPDGRILAANPAAEALFGISQAEIFARGRDGLMDVTDRRVPAALEQTARTGEFRGELSFRRADGRPFLAEVASVAFRDERGGDQISTVIKDVSERRAAEERLRVQATALQAAANGIVITEREGTIVWVNRAFTRMTGWEGHEARGKTPRILKSGEHPPEFFADPWQTVLAGRAWHGRLVNRRKDGTLYHEEQTITPFTDDRGSVTYFIAIKQDVTERVRVAEELGRQRELVLHQEKLAAMGELLAGVAHELNNPLSVVLRHVAILRSATMDPALAKRAGQISDATMRCARIVRNFVALSRQYPPELRSIDLNQLIWEAVELLAYQLRVESIEAALELAQDLPALAADSHQLQQVLVNLITNACQAMRTTSAPRRLTLTTRCDAARGSILLDVRDTGPGIPPDLRTRIWEPFLTTKPAGEGTGLGLAICRGIVERHGGTIALGSDGGRGCAFEIEVPLRGLSEPSTTGAAAPATERPAVAHVLVIDDEPEVIDLLTEILAAEGHEVVAADNGRAALDALHRRSYDAIFCDIKMPVMEGQAFHEALQGERPELARRLAFIAGDTFSSATSAFLEGSGQPFLDKPLSPDAVFRVLGELQERARGRPLTGAVGRSVVA